MRGLRPILLARSDAGCPCQSASERTDIARLPPTQLPFQTIRSIVSIRLGRASHRSSSSASASGSCRLWATESGIWRVMLMALLLVYAHGFVAGNAVGNQLCIQLERQPSGA